MLLDHAYPVIARSEPVGATRTPYDAPVGQSVGVVQLFILIHPTLGDHAYPKKLSVALASTTLVATSAAMTRLPPINPMRLSSVGMRICVMLI
jgi:hypothetical protein